jgi:autoinducer 2-degrading protein
MHVITAEYYAREGKDDEVAAHMREMVAFSNSDQEPGCILYVVNRSTDDPRRFLLYEQYVDEAAFDAHTKTPLFNEKILGAVVPLLESRERKNWEVVE